MKNILFKNDFKIIPFHTASLYFDYDIVIKWAWRLIRNNIETEDILILASFNNSPNRFEIIPYLDSVLEYLNLGVRDEEEAQMGYIKYYINGILKNNRIEDCLAALYRLHLELDDEKEQFRLKRFYTLYLPIENENEMRFRYRLIDSTQVLRNSDTSHISGYKTIISQTVEEAKKWNQWFEGNYLKTSDLLSDVFYW